MNARIVEIDNGSYHADKSRFSSSTLKDLDRSPAYYWTKNLKPDRKPEERKKSFVIGGLFHCCLLEPDKVELRYATIPDGVDIRTTVGKQLKARIQSQNMGKEIVTDSELAQCMAMAKSARSHVLGPLFGLPSGLVETSVYSDDIVPVKIRMDYHLPPGDEFPNGIIIDPKSTENARSFEGDAFNYRYHIQAGLYVRVYEAFYGVRPPFYFLAVEKEEPYGVIAYPCSEDYLARGEARAVELMQLARECVQTDSWPNYTETIKELNLPKWAKDLI